MKQSVGQKRSGWFWVGVTLLSISALWWLLIVGIIIDEPEDAAATVGVGILLSALPIGIGIYCVRRGRKAPAVGMQRGPEPAYPTQFAAEAMPRVNSHAVAEAGPMGAKDTEAEIFVRSWRDKVARIFGTLVGCVLFTVGVYGGIPVLGFIGLANILIASTVPDMGTKVTFNQPPGCMTVTRRFCWCLLRTKRISNEEARSARVASVRRPSLLTGFVHTAYQVRVTMQSGKEVSLYIGWERNKADYLAQRILEFGQH